VDRISLLGGPVEVVLGDLFESDAEFFVAPCGVTGNMSAEVRNHIVRLGVEVPVGPFKPGDVVAAPTNDTARGSVVLFAMVAQSRGGSLELVNDAARRIGSFASEADAVVAVPLLGAGAGGLDATQSMRSIIAGFQATAHPAARLRIHVLSQRLADSLRAVLSENREPLPEAAVRTPDAATPDGRVAEMLRQRFTDADLVTAGAVAAAAIDLDLGERYDLPELKGIANVGPGRSIGDHLTAVWERWSSASAMSIEFAHVALAMGLDPGVGWPLLESGFVETVVAEWHSDGGGPAWDRLSDAGRRLAEDQPLFATALGAPPEWSAILPAPATALAFSPDSERVAALAGGVVYDVGMDGRSRRLGGVDGTVVALGWGREGVLAVRLAEDAAEIIQVEKIIQIPVRLAPLDETLIRKMIAGLTAADTHPRVPGRATRHDPDSSAHASSLAPAGTNAADTVATAVEAAEGTAERRPSVRMAQFGRAPRQHLPAQILEITESEAAAMSAVAPLVGTTPRTVKRFVNTYRLLKARTKDPSDFDHPRGGIGDHEVVAFLLAVVTGQPVAAQNLLTELRQAPPDGTLRTTIQQIDAIPTPMRQWITQHPRLADAPSHRFADGISEVARFSFVSATETSHKAGAPSRNGLELPEPTTVVRPRDNPNGQ
jgi:hypothetical protein